MTLWRALVLLPGPIRQRVWQALVRRDREINPLSLTGEVASPPPRGLDRLKRALPQKYDVLLFGFDLRTENAEWINWLAQRYALDGHRVFRVGSRRSAALTSDVQLVDEGIFELGAPSASARADVAVAGDDLTPTAMQYEELAATLRYDFAVVDAVCFVFTPATRAALGAAMTRLSWRIVELARPGSDGKPTTIESPDAALSLAPALPIRLSPELDRSDAAWSNVKSFVDALYPRVSILVVTYNNLAYNRLCLGSIFDKTTYPNLEVVVVDNQSTDGTRDFLHEFQQCHENCRVVLNDSNTGFARANNAGAAVATGSFVVFLNNDTVVTAPWLSRLIHHLRDPTVGTVGPRSSRRGDESGVETSYETLGDMDDFAGALARAHEGRTFQSDRIVLFCTALRRPVFDEVGPLDERFGMGMFEDDDYAERLRRHGYRIIYAEDAFVHHWGNASFSRLDVAAYLHLMDTNRRAFEEKWGVKWNPPRRVRTHGPHSTS